MVMLWNSSSFLLCIGLSTVVLGRPGERQLNPVESLQGEQKAKPCGDHMECVAAHLCSDNGTIIRDGRTLIDFRTVSFSPRNNHGCDWTEVCCANNGKISKPDEEYVSRGCGYSNPKGLKISIQNAANGESQFGQFPWMVGIWEQHCQNGKCSYSAQGGGSLLAPNVVLTTAHKIINSSADNLMVRAGEWDTLRTTEPYAHEDRLVATKIIHPDFNTILGFFDVAILILKTPFKLAPHIDTICLPDKLDNYTQNRCIVMGWGKKQMDDPDYPNLLKKIDVPVVGRSKCQAQLRQTILTRYFELHRSFVCAGGEKDKDACFGDGGSPLVCPSSNNPDRYTLVGLVSWGVGCGVENVPGVYANVQMLRQWIQAQF